LGIDWLIAEKLTADSSFSGVLLESKQSPKPLHKVRILAPLLTEGVRFQGSGVSQAEF
jgi:hypothetical protein